MVLGIAVGIGTAIYSGIQKQKAGKVARSTARRNAVILRSRARRALEVKREEARHVRLQGKRLEARQIVLFAKSGLGGAGRGTEGLVRQETQRRVEENARIIHEQGWFVHQQLMEEAANVERGGRYAERAGNVNMFSSFASGLSNAMESWSQYQGARPDYSSPGIIEARDYT